MSFSLKLAKFCYSRQVLLFPKSFMFFDDENGDAPAEPTTEGAGEAAPAEGGCESGDCGCA